MSYLSGSFSPNMTRPDRLDLLARVLRDRPGVTAADLARELGVTARTIFRDLDRLRDRGYPVEGERGRGGGLRLRGNWGLGRVLLGREEALGTLLGLAVAERIGMPMFMPEIGRSRRKIADAFPVAERRRIAPLRDRIFVGPPASAAVRRAYGDPSPHATRHLQVAFVEERVVHAVYVREDGTGGPRSLEPHALVINWPAWYLMAYDHLRERPRTFRLDRFVTVDVTSVRFRPRPREMVAELLAESGVVLERV